MLISSFSILLPFFHLYKGEKNYGRRVDVTKRNHSWNIKNYANYVYNAIAATVTVTVAGYFILLNGMNHTYTHILLHQIHPTDRDE